MMESVVAKTSSSALDILFSVGGGAPASRAALADSSRTEATLEGTCQAQPQEASDAEAATSTRATSCVNVQLCTASRSPGKLATSPRTMRGKSISVKCEPAPRPK